MANGVFSLLEVRAEQVKNIANGNFASWSEGATYGYFGGGETPGAPNVIINTISRLDFFSETVSNPNNNLASARTELAATSNSSYGYFGGGEIPTFINTISRLDFITETVSDPGKNLPSARGNFTATQNNSYGYFGGGNDGVRINTITRIDFSTETISDPSKNLPSARASLEATQSNSYGYFGGGNDGSIINTITRLDFSNETISDPGKNLPGVRQNMGTISNNSYGYFGGGRILPSPSPVEVFTNVISRLDFSNETVSNLANNLPEVKLNLGRVSANVYGYFGGGATTVPGVFTSNISRLDFSNETVSNISNNLPSARRSSSGISGGQSILRGNGVKSYGYFGGDTPLTDRIDFSTETVNNPGKNLPSGIEFAATSSNLYGYFGGHNDPTIIRLDFSNETVSNPGKNFPSSKRRLAATSNASYGYFGGGAAGATVTCIITRLDFSNETVSDPGKNLPTIRRDLAATSNSSYGYFGGGSNVPDEKSTSSTITRLDFSNETVSNLSNNLPEVRSYLTATSSSSYGYFGGGTISDPNVSNARSTIIRFDFSNETTSSTTNLPSTRLELAATSSSSYGYFAGGRDPGTSSLISRLNFSTETVNNTTNLLSTRALIAAVSNSN